ncbi:MAG: hypothetical protein NTV51_29725 [Verrucomicrobia bacterium]|nr:hypothetical protein [Verrucomicrobiota bacterium]
MNASKIISAGLGVGAVVAVGVWLAVKLGWGESATGRMGRPEPAGSAVGQLVEENRRLKAQLAEVRAAALRPATEAGGGAGPKGGARVVPPVAWRALADLQRRGAGVPQITFVTGKGEMTDAFATLFALNSAERAAVVFAVSDAAARLAELALAHATITRDEKGDVTVAVKSFPAAGGAVYDALMQRFKAALGEERYAAFVALGADQVEAAMGRFGAPDVSFTVSNRAGPGDADGFDLRSTYRMPTEHNMSNGRYRTLADAENKFGPVIRLFSHAAAQPR